MQNKIQSKNTPYLYALLSIVLEKSSFFWKNKFFLDLINDPKITLSADLKKTYRQMHHLINFFSPILDLVFPNLCTVCSENLVKGEKIICTTCLYELPKTNYWNQAENPISQLFWGRLELNHASSYFIFKKGSSFQKLLHQLKYKGKYQIGVELGKAFGHDLSASPFYQTIDLIVPVPLHPRREKQRGYNQSLAISEGLSESMKIPVKSILIRSEYSETQTKKTRIARWENVENIFKLKENEKIDNKHILLVDDVITTGATLESCASIIYQTPNCNLSIVTLASA